MGHTKLHNLKA